MPPKCSAEHHLQEVIQEVILQTLPSLPRFLFYSENCGSPDLRLLVFPDDFDNDVSLMQTAH